MIVIGRRRRRLMASVEKRYTFIKTDSKLFEKIIEDEHVGINHLVLQKGEALPEHFTNSNVYVIVVRGTITLQLGKQKPHVRPEGSIINIPYNIKMNASNRDEQTLEFLVVKAPNPPYYKHRKKMWNKINNI
jgi:quercetin dioxygenase-like cupin family protein